MAIVWENAEANTRTPRRHARQAGDKTHLLVTPSQNEFAFGRQPNGEGLHARSAKRIEQDAREGSSTMKAKRQDKNGRPWAVSRRSSLEHQDYETCLCFSPGARAFEGDMSSAPSFDDLRQGEWIFLFPPLMIGRGGLTIRTGFWPVELHSCRNVEGAAEHDCLP